MTNLPIQRQTHTLSISVSLCKPMFITYITALNPIPDLHKFTQTHVLPDSLLNIKSAIKSLYHIYYITINYIIYTI